MKINVFEVLLLVCILSACHSKQESTFCENEKKLIAGNTLLEANFDFELNNEMQLNSIHDQIAGGICNQKKVIVADFRLEDYETVKTLLYTDYYCPDSAFIGSISCVFQPSVNIFFNNNGQILFDQEYVLEKDLDSIIVYTLSSKPYREDARKFFSIHWDPLTPAERKYFFKLIYKAYLRDANRLSVEMYEVGICQLDEHQIDELVSHSKFLWKLKNFIPLKSKDHLHLDTISFWN